MFDPVSRIRILTRTSVAICHQNETLLIHLIWSALRHNCHLILKHVELWSVGVSGEGIDYLEVCLLGHLVVCLFGTPSLGHFEGCAFGTLWYMCVCDTLRDVCLGHLKVYVVGTCWGICVWDTLRHICLGHLVWNTLRDVCLGHFDIRVFGTPWCMFVWDTLRYVGLGHLEVCVFGTPWGLGGDPHETHGCRELESLQYQDSTNVSSLCCPPLSNNS